MHRIKHSVGFNVWGFKCHCGKCSILRQYVVSVELDFMGCEHNLMQSEGQNTFLHYVTDMCLSLCHTHKHTHN